MLRVFSFLLPSSHVPQHLRQLIYITNILALILSGLTFILCYLLFNIFGWLATFKYILLVADIFVVVIFINRINWNLGRILFCLTPVWMTIFVSLYGKAIHSDQSYITYFDARMLLLATTILPAIVFKLYERLEIAVCLLSTFVFLDFV